MDIGDTRGSANENLTFVEAFKVTQEDRENPIASECNRESPPPSIPKVAADQQQARNKGGLAQYVPWQTPA